VQLCERHIQGAQNAHGKLIERKTNVRVYEHAGMNIEEIMAMTLLAMTHAIYQGTTLSKQLYTRLPCGKHRHNNNNICVQHG